MQGEGAAFLKDLKAKVHTGQKIEDANRKKALTLSAWFDELAGKKETNFKASGWKTACNLPRSATGAAALTSTSKAPLSPICP